MSAPLLGAKLTHLTRYFWADLMHFTQQFCRTGMPPKKSIQLDDFDLAILDQLQINNRTSLQEIGQSVNLSAAAVQRRVRRMEDARVIQSNAAIVDPASVGRPITIIVEVQVDSEHADLMDSARSEFAAAPEVQQCYYVTGAADFILVLTVSTMEEYEQLSRRLFLENKNVRHFNTFVAMNRVKAGLRVPLSRT
ncbi:DNA-binding Lrp family transcriptional regulator [Afipia massiliensis]|uniref:DNA-binding Lrp family transcriptional regulator n=2 Tax=Afipia massiliensis TaxID=211460 RepID=A0A840N3G8_9BRAD|nr:DNA-binding Lrp family transcriptional regulator [Afipia massiliensis]